jgi:crotonobetainyl-CoA:carnitine CoA-transferase CaiB-like acyl-CoA transferase
MPAALEHLRILDFSQMMLGPYGTQMLADLGADVIKVERPGRGEWERDLAMFGELVGDTSAAFLAMNRNKRSLAIDLKHPEARDALLRIGATCDVVVENFRPGVLSRLGLGYDDFCTVRPDIIYCSGSGWGQDTVYAREGRPGQDLLIQAMSGLAHNAGRRDDPPTVAGSSLCDAMTALTLVNGILAAVVARDRLGIGQRVEVDLYSTTMAVLCQEISAMVNQDVKCVRSEAGVAQPWLAAPFGVYRTADGWIALSMAPIDRIAAIFDEPAIAHLDPWVDRDEIKRILDDAVPARSTDVWVELLLAEDMWCAPVRTLEEAVAEFRRVRPDMVLDVRSERLGDMELIGCPITMSATPWSQRLAPPDVGQHSFEVLAEVLDDAEVARLHQGGAVQ